MTAKTESDSKDTTATADEKKKAKPTKGRGSSFKQRGTEKRG